MEHQLIQSIAAGVILGGGFLLAIVPLAMRVMHEIDADVVTFILGAIVVLIGAYVLHGPTGANAAWQWLIDLLVAIFPIFIVLLVLGAVFLALVSAKGRFDEWRRKKTGNS